MVNPNEAFFLRGSIKLHFEPLPNSLFKITFLSFVALKLGLLLGSTFIVVDSDIPHLHRHSRNSVQVNFLKENLSSFDVSSNIVPLLLSLLFFLEKDINVNYSQKIKVSPAPKQSIQPQDFVSADPDPPLPPCLPGERQT